MLKVIIVDESIPEPPADATVTLVDGSVVHLESPPGNTSNIELYVEPVVGSSSGLEAVIKMNIAEGNSYGWRDSDPARMSRLLSSAADYLDTLIAQAIAALPDPDSGGAPA